MYTSIFFLELMLQMRTMQLSFGMMNVTDSGFMKGISVITMEFWNPIFWSLEETHHCQNYIIMRLGFAKSMLEIYSPMKCKSYMYSVVSWAVLPPAGGHGLGKCHLQYPFFPPWETRWTWIDQSFCASKGLHRIEICMHEMHTLTQILMMHQAMYWWIIHGVALTIT